MKHLAIILCLVTSSFCLSRVSPVKEDWEAFKTKYEKNYVTETEDRHRHAIYLENKRYVAEHNKEFAEGKHTFILGMNQFSDMIPDEFETYKGPKTHHKIETEVSLHKKVNTQALPDSVDWRTAGAVTPVQNQGSCGSAWPYSATGSLEGQMQIQTGLLQKLSEQNLIDCVADNDGCNSGTVEAAYIYVQNNGGIDTAAGYPYVPPGNGCVYDTCCIGGHCSDHVNLPSGDEAALQDAVANIGPISAAMDASHFSFQLYTSGIYSDAGCSTTILDHWVLIVGYGTNAFGDYWIVKNTWGTSWGMAGYFNLARNAGNMCGIATVASYPIVF